MFYLINVKQNKIVMAAEGTKMYIFSHYAVFPWTNTDTTPNPYNWKWYTNLKDHGGKTTRIGFTSLADARKWCKSNYLLGIAKGWIK